MGGIAYIIRCLTAADNLAARGLLGKRPLSSRPNISWVDCRRRNGNRKWNMLQKQVRLFTTVGVRSASRATIGVGAFQAASTELESDAGTSNSMAYSCEYVLVRLQRVEQGYREQGCSCPAEITVLRFETSVCTKPPSHAKGVGTIDMVLTYSHVFTVARYCCCVYGVNACPYNQ